MFNVFKKTIKDGEQVYPDMVSIIIDPAVVDGVNLFSISYVLYIDPDLQSSRVLELGTTLYSEVSLDDSIIIAIEYAEALWSLDAIYPTAVVREESGEATAYDIRLLVIEYAKHIYYENGENQV